MQTAVLGRPGAWRAAGAAPAHRAAAPTRTAAPLRAVRCAAAAPQQPRAQWVERCLRRAQQSAVMVGGVPFIPLAEAQRWFEAGEHTEEAKHQEELEAVMAERARLASEMQVMAETALKDHDAQDQKLRRLLNYALALERELDAAKGGMEEAALAAAHEAEEHALLQYQQALMAFERMQQAETHEAEAGLRAEVKRLHDLLHAAHGAKKQWRERALQVEAQFGQLRCLIQTSLQQTSEAALWRQQQAAAAAPPPLNTNARMRSSEEVAPADADVAVQHHSMSPAGARKTAAVRPPGSSKGRGVKHQRGAEPRCSGESLHSL